MLVGENLQVRVAVESDLSQFAADPNRLGLLRDRLRRQWEHRGELWLAVHHDQPVGHIYLWRELAEEDVIRTNLPHVPLIMNLWVRGDHRRMGVATRLMAAGEERLAQFGYTRVALGVDPTNITAIKMYENLNYTLWDGGILIETRDLDFNSAGEVISEGPDVCILYLKTLGPQTQTAGRI